MTYVVRPSKGDFLLHTVMNLAGFNENAGYLTLHPLREKTREHYAKEINNPLVLEFYNLWRKGTMQSHPPLSASVDLQRIELGYRPSDDSNSRRIRNVLERFKNSTDFDEFYESISSDYALVCDEVRNILCNVPLENILNDAWELDADFEVSILPQPLSYPFNGHELAISNNAVAIVGPRVVNGIPSYEDASLLKLIAHEISHTYLDKIVDQIIKIAESRGLTRKLSDFVDYQRAENYSGRDVLIETTIRALQTRYVNPLIQVEEISIEDALMHQRDDRGFKYILEFDEAIRRHKQNPKGSLAEEIVDLMERLV